MQKIEKIEIHLHFSIIFFYSHFSSFPFVYDRPETPAYQS